MPADADEFPYPKDAVPRRVLQVAAVEGARRSCEGAVFSPTSLLQPQHFSSTQSFFLHPILSLSLSIS